MCASHERQSPEMSGEPYMVDLCPDVSGCANHKCRPCRKEYVWLYSDVGRTYRGVEAMGRGAHDTGIVEGDSAAEVQTGRDPRVRRNNLSRMMRRRVCPRALVDFAIELDASARN